MTTSPALPTLEHLLKLYEQAQFETVTQLCKRLLEQEPSNHQAWYLLGISLRALGQLKPALTSLDQALALNPNWARAWFSKGNVFTDLHQPEQALDSYEHALARQANHADTWLNRGNTLRTLKQHRAALDSYDRAIALKPDRAQIHLNRGGTLIDLHQFHAALEAFDTALSLQPNYAQAHYTRGLALHHLGEHAAALQSYQHACSLQPDYADAYVAQAHCYLQLGQFEQGWPLNEWRWKKAHNLPFIPSYAKPRWLGKQSLQGKSILLSAEQGLGDVLQFCRYLPQVKALGARTILGVHQPLFNLLKTLAGVDTLLATGDPVPEFDYHCPLLSLPLAFGTTVQSIPTNVPYLYSLAKQVAYWQKRLGTRSKPRIGIVWSGNPDFPGNYQRSTNLEHFIRHLPSGFQYISLKKELDEADQQTLKSRPDILHFGDELKDLSDTAALCDCVDLVISTCTSVAHLAGAMDRPVWIILQANPDWRWLLQRSDSPWYPSARLYRQSQAGDWDSVLANVAANLVEEFHLDHRNNPLK